MSRSGDQFAHEFAVVQDMHRAFLVIGNREDRVDTEMAVQGRQNIGGCVRLTFRSAAVTIGFADDLADAETAASDHCRAGFGPVVATVTARDSRCSAKLAPHHDGDIFVQSTFV